MFDLSLIGAPAFLLQRRDDHRFAYIELNGLCERLIGWSRDDLRGKTASEAFGPDAGALIEGRQLECAESLIQVHYETPAQTPLGERHYESTLTPVIDPDGVVRTLFGITADVSQRRGLENDLRVANLRLNLAMEALGGAHWFFDTAQHAFELSPAFEKLLGGRVPRVMSVDEWQQHVVEEDRDDTCFADLLAGRANEGTAEFRVQSGDGSTRWVRCRRQSIRNGSNVVGIAGIVLDITNEKRREADLSLQAQSDGLTGLANRRRFDALVAAAGATCPLAILMIDVDHFKAYNDDYGHVAGDQVLRSVAAVLDRSASLAGGIAARYGGEEFAIVMRNADRVTVARTAITILKDLDGLAVPHGGSPKGHVTLSIGIALSIPDRPTDPYRLISLADEALYQAKAGGRACYRVASVAGSGTRTAA